MNEFARPNLAVDQLPPANSADKDKVLTIDASGVPVWAENSGGGSSGGVLVVGMDADTGALDKTWQEIHDADYAVLKANIDGMDSWCYLIMTYASDDGYEVAFCMTAPENPPSFEVLPFSADSANGYPVSVGD